MKMMNLDRMEAERGEIKETTRKKMEALAMNTALECIASTLENIGSRLTQKRRADAMASLHNVRVHLICNADTTEKDVHAVIKVLGIIEETGNSDATSMEFIKMANAGEWKYVPAVLCDLLRRLGFYVDYEDPTEETTETTETTEPTETAEQPKMIVKKRREHESFEAFQADYFAAHPSIVQQFEGCIKIIKSLEQQAEEVRRTLEAVHRGEELSAAGPAGTSSNGLPMYWDHFGNAIEAPAYLEHLKAEAESSRMYIANINEKMRRLHIAEEMKKEEAQAVRARIAYINTVDACDVAESMKTPEAIHEAKKFRTLAAEAYALYLRTRAAEWVEELETLHREAYACGPLAQYLRTIAPEGAVY